MQIDQESHWESFQSLEHLVIARGRLTWDQVLQCCTSVMNLKQLQVPFNEITHLDHRSADLSKLTSLDLEGNPIVLWSEVNKLGTLPNLVSLNVCGCQIHDIFLPADLRKTNLFQQLQHLIISENLLNDWGSISELDKLPSLIDVKCLKNPVLDKDSLETNHQLIIARIRRLKVRRLKLIYNYHKV